MARKKLVLVSKILISFRLKILGKSGSSTQIILVLIIKRRKLSHHSRESIPVSDQEEKYFYFFYLVDYFSIILNHISQYSLLEILNPR